MYNFVSKLGKVEICVHMFELCKRLLWEFKFVLLFQKGYKNFP